MKKMKKAAAALLAAVMAAALLAGCGGEGDSSGSSSAGGTGSSSSGAADAPAAFDYSGPLTDSGNWAGIKALSYVTLGEYEGIEVPAEVHTVSQQEIDAQLESLLSSYAAPVQVTDRAIADGDTVNIDYVGRVDGVEFEGGSTGGAGTLVTIGVTNYIDDFLQQLIGHRPGEQFDIEVTFPEDYGKEELNGKDAVFSITVNYIQETSTPELTDEFVQQNLSAGYGWQTAQELVDQLRADLEWNATAQYLWSKVTGEAEISELPAPMLDYELDRSVFEYQQMAQGYGMTLQQALELAGVTSVEELGEQYAPQMEQNARDNLVAQALAETLGIEATDEEVAAYFKEFVGVEDYSPYVEQYGEGFVRMTVLSRLVVDHLVQAAVLA